MVYEANEERWRSLLRAFEKWFGGTEAAHKRDEVGRVSRVVDLDNRITIRKKCGRCGRLKFRESFARHSKSPDGLQSWCRDCQTTHNRQARKCGKCGRRKARSQFNRDARAKSGLQSYCKTCSRASSRRWSRNQ